jgi:NADH-quinone oxidoreductase subunit C
MTRDELKAQIESKFGETLSYSESGKFDLMYLVKADDLIEVARLLKEDEQLDFNFLCNITGVDTTESYEVVYSVASLSRRTRLDLKVVLPHDNPSIESVQEIWIGANWHEREIWELYGIDIKNHGNLKRFLLPDDWDQGFPMRKDWDAPDFVRMPEL